MAKNLKINVKNAQLAQALNLGKVKKPAAKKKKSEESEVADVATPPVVEPVVTEKPTPVPPPVEEKPVVAEKPAPPPPPEKPREAPAAQSEPRAPYQSRPPYQGSRPPYQPGGTRPPYQQGPRPPYQSGSRPPYQPGGTRPPYQPGGARPPYQPGGQRPPYQPGSRPPYQPGNRPPYQPGGARPPYQPGSRPPYQPGSRPPYQGGGARPPFAPKEPPRAEDRKAIKPPKKKDEDLRKVGMRDVADAKGLRKQEERSFDARDRQGLRSELDEQIWRKRRPAQKMRHVQQEEVVRPKSLSVRIPITVKDLASEMKLKASQLISKLFMKGVVITLNDFLDDETTIQLLGHDFDCEIKIDTSEESRIRITDRTIKQEIQESDPEALELRPPVVAFMGHVDHGKTSLIDTIRKSNIASGEAGAITQHIGAFKCQTDAGPLTILDTPGHEAFSAMRARGADVTDIVVLVIAGDEGIRTQTVEALTQAQTAGVPILVALNKCDKPNFNAENVYRQLAEHNLLPESWGGQTITVNCSAVTGEGIKELLEMLALQAEVLELKANPATRARGTVIESEMHKGLGLVATVLVQNGTLHLGDAVVFAQHYARIKTMQDEHNKDLKVAPPSTPVKITGLSGLPEAGSEFIVVKSEKEAMEIAEKRLEGQRHALQQIKRPGGLEGFLAEKAASGQKKVLNLILRADVQGSVEALKTSLMKIASTKAELNILSAGVGEISESDIQLAHASKATILGFHTAIESHADSLIKQLKVTVKMHDIIYHAVEDIRELMRKLLDKLPQETEMGEAEVLTTFKSSQLGIIAGCMVTNGTIKRSNHMRLLRGGNVIWKGPIASLKRVKEDVKEVSKGYECGILLQGFSEVKTGDILQAYEITYLEQDL
ncbi:MAG: translation initiation factor IF-2 [Verrucomicrobia bacterium]|nr:translation initiation factor IF-2 [Verrucomicrobiota bacterium]